MPQHESLWEYEQVPLVAGKEQEALNEYGRNGWELVAIVSVARTWSSYLMAFFKRHPRS